jgi:hypothetical protein
VGPAVARITVRERLKYRAGPSGPEERPGIGRAGVEVRRYSSYHLPGMRIIVGVCLTDADDEPAHEQDID